MLEYTQNAVLVGRKKYQNVTKVYDLKLEDIPKEKYVERMKLKLTKDVEEQLLMNPAPDNFINFYMEAVI